MQKLLPAMCTVLTFAAVAACGVDRSVVVGVYHLDTSPMRAAAAAGLQNPDEATKAEVKLLIDGFHGTLELKTDGTSMMSLTMPLGGGDNAANTPGTWQFDGERLLLKSQENGAEVTKIAKFAEGVITIDLSAGGRRMPMVFRRQ